MNLLILLLHLMHLVASQQTSRLRTRTSSNAVCTLNTGTATATATLDYATILSVHHDTDAECPQAGQLGIHYHNEVDVGCCTQSATLKMESGIFGCCLCGVVCTGSIPAMADWYFAGTQLVIETSTSTSALTTISSSPPGSQPSSSSTSTSASSSMGTGEAVVLRGCVPAVAIGALVAAIAATR